MDCSSGSNTSNRNAKLTGAGGGGRSAEERLEENEISQAGVTSEYHGG